MNCAKCQQPVPDKARFCGRCGTAIAPVAEAAAFPAPRSIGSSQGAETAAAASGFLQRVKNIVLSPKSEWPVCALEPLSSAQLYTGYIAPLAALAAVMSFVHLSLIGIRIPFGDAIRTPITSGLVYSGVAFGFGLVGVFLVALIINGLAPTFSGERDQRQALKVAAYSLTPAWLSTVFVLLPGFSTLLQFIAGLYGIYVLYLGLPILMRTPREKAFGYTAAVVVCTILLGIVFGTLSMLGGRFENFTGMPGSDAASQAAARERGAETAANVIGGMLGTDAQGKAGLGAALSNLAKAGEKSEQQAAGANQSDTASNAPVAESPTAAASSGQSDAAQSQLGAAGGLLTALGGALGGSHRVDPVDFRTLRQLLPESLPDMRRSNTEGENQQAIGVKTSTAKADYQGAQGTTIHLEIADMSGVSGLMDVAGALVQNTTSESDAGFEKDVAIGGRSVHEKYDYKSKKGDLTVMLAKRFQVELTGDGVEMSALERALGKVDLARLESMKNQGAKPQ
jgi:hypothetical protein